MASALERDAVGQHPPATTTPDAEKERESTSDHDTHVENPNELTQDNTVDRTFFDKYGTYDRYEITEDDCYDELGFSFPTWKKWMILSIVFTVQVSMNFNTSLYSNATHGISEEYGVSAQAARLGAAIFLLTYAFGCELWAVSYSSARAAELKLTVFSHGVKSLVAGLSSSSVCSS
jgi:hypothetical protein